MEKEKTYSNDKENFRIVSVKDGIAEVYSETGVDFLKIKPGKSGYVAEEILDIFLQADLKDFKQKNN